MKKFERLDHEFVEFIPDQLVPGKLYISLEYATAVHQCCCGCGNEVVTPLSPTDWKLIFNGEAVSLHPSIGNWSFDCRSHYWIRDGVVSWAEQWSPEQIAAGRILDQQRKKQKLSQTSTGASSQSGRRDGFNPLKAVWMALRKLF